MWISSYLFLLLALSSCEMTKGEKEGEEIIGFVVEEAVQIGTGVNITPEVQAIESLTPVKK